MRFQLGVCVPMQKPKVKALNGLKSVCVMNY